ncbi:MAG: NADH-quinone oxidoreductase subunit C [Armatimonadota bacterium]
MGTSVDIKQEITNKYRGSVKDAGEASGVPMLYVDANGIVDLCSFLQQTEGLDFDYLASLCAVDLSDRFEVVYHIYSLQMKHTLILKVKLNVDTPSIPSVYQVWKAADWQEREVYDMFGINIEGHPDLRRILLEPDWEGFPLRKSYKETD